MKKYFRVTYYSAIVLLFLIVALGGYTQTSAFRNALRTYLLNNAWESIHGTLSLGTIEGNFLTGLKVTNVAFSEQGRVVLAAERVQVKYDPVAFFVKRVGITDAIVENAEIHLVRSSDGSWNIDRLFRSEQPDTVPSPWIIDIKNIVLKNARVELIDSLALERRLQEENRTPDSNAIDYAHLQLDSLFLRTSFFLAHQQYEATLHSMAWKMTKPAVTLRHLEGTFVLQRNNLLAKNVRILLPHSDVQLRASLRDVNIFEHLTLAEFRGKPLKLELTAAPLNADELKQFLSPYVDFLQDTATVHLRCSGTFDNVTVEECTVVAGATAVHLNGTVKNLHTPSHLELHVVSKNSTIDPSLRNELLAGLPLPDLSRFGTVQLAFTFDGEPEEFRTTVLARSALGILETNTNVSFKTQPFTYEGVARIRELNLGKILEDSALSSSLNGHIAFSGAGSNLQTMTTVVKIELDSSIFRDLPLTQTVLVANTADGTFHSHGRARLGSGYYEISSELFFSTKATRYNYRGKVISCNLGEILHNHRYESSLSFQFYGDGKTTSGVGYDSLSFSFFPSNYGTRTIESGTVKISHALKKENNERTITIASEPLQAHFQGSFTVASLIKSFTHTVDQYALYFSDYLFALDSLRSHTISKRVQQYVSHQAETTHCRFSLHCTDLSVIGTFFSFPFEGDITLDGTLHTSPFGDGFDVHATASEFGVDVGSGMLSGTQVSVRINAEHLPPQNGEQTFRTSAALSAASFLYNHLLSEKLDAAFTAKSDSGIAELHCRIDSTVTIGLWGEWVKLPQNFLECKIPRLSLRFDSLYEWRNSIPIRFTLGADGGLFHSFVLSHDTAAIVLSGLFDPSGASDVTAELREFSLTDLRHIFHRTPSTNPLGWFGGKAKGNLKFKNTFENPILSVSAQVENGTIQEVPFGTATAHIEYEHQRVRLSLGIKTLPTTREPDIVVEGSIPVLFQLTSGDRQQPLEGEVDLHVQAEKMNAVLLSPLLPFLQNISGTISCNFKMIGPLDAPRYDGSATFSNVRFLFKPLGIQYILNGSVVSEEDHVRLENVTLLNVPDDKRPDGRLSVEGTLSLYGLSLKYFSLRANGELLVMKESQRPAGQNLYGTLYIATPPNGITWEGTGDHSLVKGELYLLDAQLIFPPERELAPVRVGTIVETFENDTATVQEVSMVKKLGKGNGTSKEREWKVPESSFLDNIDYDLSIETRGSTTIRFVFNTQTSEELFAVLQGRLSYNRTGSVSRVVGQVEVAERSYYNFFKKFDAAGKLTFTGDLLNPEIAVTARYEGLHMRDTSNVFTTTSSTQSSSERIAVILAITGTRNEPQVRTTLERYENNQWMKYETGDDESNALSFVLSGQFTDELTAQQRTSFIGTNLGFGLAAGMITGPLSAALRRNTGGYVQSLDVLYYGGQFEKAADVRLTGQVGEAVIRLGGRVINDPVGNTNVSVELPLSPLSRNLILSLEHKVEGTEFSEEQRRSYNSAKIFYRFTF